MDKEITLEHDEANQVVKVFCNDDLFTSYRYDSTFEKPILYPVIASHGQRITRKYPLEYSVGERVDHPHHAGIWLNYGDVNGLDFWNNSVDKNRDHPEKYGWIKHDAILEISNGQTGTLRVLANWENHSGEVLLREVTTYQFSANGDTRLIERSSTLEALDHVVQFNDNKEGMFGIRVARALELISDKPVLLSGADGEPATEKIHTNAGVTGDYLASTGKKGNDVWGTRAEWVKLHGEVDEISTAVTIADHPKNPGYPTYWHARGYGLFAANPLGQAVFSKGSETLNFTLQPKEKATFKYLIVIESGKKSSKDQMTKRLKAFTKI